MNTLGVDKTPCCNRNLETILIFLLFQGRKTETRMVLRVWAE